MTSALGQRVPGAVSSGRQPIGNPIELDSKRRFTIAVAVGTAVTAVPYLWVLFDLWTGGPSLLRTAFANGGQSNFYDLQARAILHGHLNVPPSSLGSEAFVHNGEQFTYFGIFPSLIRIPVLLVTHSLDGKLTALSLLVAWLATAAFSALLLWRIRMLVRGPVVLGLLEAIASGVFVAAITGGSVLVFLASDPFVFSEDLAWSVALTIGTMFALLGVLERPSWGRIAPAGGLILAANLTRVTTGYACVIGAGIAAAWLALDRKNLTRRKRALPVAATGLFALIIGSALTYAKFGVFLGVPVSDQVVYRQFGLSGINGGNYFGVHFLPSTLFDYLGPTGLRLTPVFPFITLPPTLAPVVGGVMLFGRDRVASMLPSEPLLFFGGLWGLVCAIRPHQGRRANFVRVPLLACAVAAGAILVYGWIENRFEADLLPLVIVASALALVDVFRRLEGRTREARIAYTGIIVVVGLFEVIANFGIAVGPQGTWSTEQVFNYVSAQKAVSDLTGHPLASNILRGDSLPGPAPAEILFIAGRCDALYISDGGGTDPYSTWRPAEYGPALRRTLVLTVNGPVASVQKPVRLATVGPGASSTIIMQPSSQGAIEFAVTGPLNLQQVGMSFAVEPHHTYYFDMIVDPYLRSVTITATTAGATVNAPGYQDTVLQSGIAGRGPVVWHSDLAPPRQASGPFTVHELKAPPPSLCTSLP